MMSLSLVQTWLVRLLTLLSVVIILGSLGIYVGMQLLGFEFYKIRTTSMEPSFGAGDVVAVKTTPIHKIGPGDIIAFHSPAFAEPVVHRVSRVQSDPDIYSIYQNEKGEIIGQKWTWSQRIFWTKGDNNEGEDLTTVTDENVLGEMKFVVPFPFNLVVTLIGQSALFALGIGAIVIYVLWEIWDGIRGRMRKGQKMVGSREGAMGNQ
jgi:signal peptidase I